MQNILYVSELKINLLFWCKALNKNLYILSISHFAKFIFQESKKIAVTKHEDKLIETIFCLDKSRMTGFESVWKLKEMLSCYQIHKLYKQ